MPTIFAAARQTGQSLFPGAHDRPPDATPTLSRASSIARTLPKPPPRTPRTGTACDCSNTATASAGTRISQISLPGLDQGDRYGANEAQSRQPVNSPDQRKPQDITTTNAREMP